MHKPNSLGKWVRAARQFHGVSLNELAKRTSISKGHLSKIENDDDAAANVTLLLAAKLTQAFGMPLWHVLKITAKSA